jgi:ATP-dependent helicase Lhr and Lhr-like helicase
MNSPPSRSDTPTFELLDEGVKEWIWRNGWDALRPVQERAITALLTTSQDLIVAAATAAGKTEAAFLPILTSLRRDPIEAGIGALYVAPLKALINDQHQRLELLCEATGIELASWHGDVGDRPKRQVRERPRGILMITPESLESIFVNHGSSAPRIFGQLRYVVIDELHAFIGSERGRQLQSLLHRIELAGRRKPRRIGLSATLGDMAIAAEFMRPGGGSEVGLIQSADDHRTLRVQLRGYVARPPIHPAETTGASADPAVEDDETSPAADRLEITEHLYGALRGTDNLVFANSRQSVEEFADLLRRRCEEERVPVEFFPHHSNLSKTLREDVERMLRSSRPATAICTSTLELGIDVGSVNCVGQIDPPFSTAALRQRLGRSGRRPGDPSSLRMYVTESDPGPNAAPSDELREGLVQSMALVDALIDGWFEPPTDGALHLSTLIQQLLSVIAQNGGALADDVWAALCGSGPFDLDRQEFVKLLRGLAARDVIQQAGDRELILTPRGEQIVGHYSFYSAFTTSEEYRLLSEGTELGTIPVRSPLSEGAYLIFGGRRWKVVGIDEERRVITVVPAKGGKVPRFFGGAGELHDEIRRRMREIYLGDSVPAFLDPRAKELLRQGRAAFRSLGLDRRQIIPFEDGSAYFPWKGDRVTSTLALGIRAKGRRVEAEGQALIVREVPPAELRDVLSEAFGPTVDPDPVWLAGTVKNLATEKHHWLLEPELLLRDCATARLDVVGAKAAVAELAEVEEAGTESKPLGGVAASSGATRYVVLDCETTGLHVGAQHRIVELALLVTDAHGEIVDRWSTLLCPDRDLGPIGVHGIRAREVLDAPRFGDVLGDVCERLAGHVLIAHNARFDRAFIENELARGGVDLAPLPMVCTMELASRLAIGGTRRRLIDCCASLGLAAPSHTALGDAEASAAILSAYLDSYGGTDALVKGRLRRRDDWPADGPRAEPKGRGASSLEPPERSALADLIARADLPPGRDGADETAYLEVLERTIEDRHLNSVEREELIATAAMLGIDEQGLHRLHGDYLDHLISVARRDGEITAREREDLCLVGQTLGVSDLDMRMDQPRAPVPVYGGGAARATGLAGQTVCFTGALTCYHDGELMTRQKATDLATNAGLTVLPRVTKKLDLLVLADPDSMSGKAKQAREYGVRLIAETAFWEMIGVEVR